MKTERPQKQDESGVYLWVKGYGEDASIVTAMIGLEPTRVWAPGQPLSPTSRVASRIHKWRLDSPLPALAHLDEHIEALLRVLEPYSENIGQAARLFEAGVSAYAYFRVDWQPGIFLSAQAVEALASMSLELDFDLYFLGRDGDTEAR